MNNEKKLSLITAIDKSISSNPHELDGHTWAARSQDDWCADLGFSLATLKRLISEPPIVREASMVGGVKMTLLRVGEPGPLTHRQIAKHMANVWRKALNNRPTTPKEFGCLVGLAEVWPEGIQVDIFKSVMKNWPGFMAGAKTEVYVEGGELRYFQYPSISFMRRYPAVGYELWAMEQQAKSAK